MLKHLMNGSSLLALALRAPDDDNGAAAKNELREKLAKSNIPESNLNPPEKKEEEKEEDKEGDEEDEEDDDKEEDEEGEDDKEKEEDKSIETDAEKAEREKNEKIAAKAQRKQDRMQARIDEAVGKAKAAEAELARVKAQLEADPDKKLTEAEVETRAKAIAAEEKRAADLKKLQDDFEADCEALQKGAKKFDKDFDAKVNDMAEQFGAIPSFMIGVLSDLENGAEVLAKIAGDDDIAEEIYDLAKKPTKLSVKLVELSKELIDAKKPKKKKISKVPDPVEQVRGSRAESVTLTEADTKDMNTFIRKRQAMMLERRKMGR